MLAWLAYITVAVVWGSTYFAIALGLESFTPYGMVAARFSVASVLALGLGRLRREPWPPLREVGHLMVVGALLLGGSNALVSWAELHLSSGLAAILAALVPLWLALFSMRKEPLGPKGWAGILLGIAGVAVLVWPSGSRARPRGRIRGHDRRAAHLGLGHPPRQAPCPWRRAAHQRGHPDAHGGGHRPRPGALHRRAFCAAPSRPRPLAPSPTWRSSGLCWPSPPTSTWPRPGPPPRWAPTPT